MPYKEEWMAAWRIPIYVVFFVAVGLGAATLVLMWKPWAMAYEREIYQESRQYVEAKQRMLIQMVTEYEAAEEGSGHANVLLTRIQSEAQLLPASEVPSSVTPYLRR